MLATDRYARDYPVALYRNDRPARPVDRLDRIDAEGVDRFGTDGFLAVRSALTADQVESAMVGLDEVLADPAPEVSLQLESWADPTTTDRDERLDGVRRLMRFTESNRRLLAIAEDPHILAAARRLLGADQVRMIQDMALLKPPGGGREKPWHQDKAFFNLDLAAPVIGVWIALDAATPENGCMHVIAGSHRGGAVPHFDRRDWQICDDQVDAGRDVVVPLEPGGLMLFDGYLQHGTPANLTDTRRRALQFHYAAADIESITDDDRMAVFGLEGRGAEC